MHTTLVELLENMKPGLLWVNREGSVRYANADATERTGLAQGRRIFEPALQRAVASVGSGQGATTVHFSGIPTDFGAVAPTLECRVLPGFAKDDAFVLIAPDPGKDKDVAFDNLMQVLKSDLGDPLREAQARLNRVRESRAGEDRGEVDELFDGVAELVSLLDRVADLAAIWGSGALLDNDRIELWDLLMKAWAQAEPLALSRGVTVTFKSQVPTEQLPAMYGSQHWLMKVFQECIGAAVRSTRTGATLTIEHKQMGPRALIIFRDSGVFATNVAGAEALPRTGQRHRGSLPQKGRDYIGLRLARQIIALHGGALREENEAGVRNFLIDLPTGAPHRSEQGQLDIAQAQRYAKDLAALMARARKRPAAPATANPAPAAPTATP